MPLIPLPALLLLIHAPRQREREARAQELADGVFVVPRVTVRRDEVGGEGVDGAGALHCEIGEDVLQSGSPRRVTGLLELGEVDEVANGVGW